MSLILIFRNQVDPTQTIPDVCDYRVTVSINQQVIEVGRVEGHRRTDGWEVLVKKFLETRTP